MKTSVCLLTAEALRTGMNQSQRNIMRKKKPLRKAFALFSPSVPSSQLCRLVCGSCLNDAVTWDSRASFTTGAFVLDVHINMETHVHFSFHF